MNANKAILNARALTDSESETLLAALEMAIIVLEDSPVEGAIKGLAVSEHLTNLTRLIELIQGDSWLDPTTPRSVSGEQLVSGE